MKQPQKISKLGVVKGRSSAPEDVAPIPTPKIGLSPREEPVEDVPNDRLGMATAFESAEAKRPCTIYIPYRLVSYSERSVTSNMSGQEGGQRLSPELELLVNESSISSDKMQHSGTDDGTHSDRFQGESITFRERFQDISDRLSSYFYDFQTKSSHRK